jgi:hypothetical protein
MKCKFILKMLKISLMPSHLVSAVEPAAYANLRMEIPVQHEKKFHRKDDIVCNLPSSDDVKQLGVAVGNHFHEGRSKVSNKLVVAEKIIIYIIVKVARHLIKSVKKVKKRISVTTPLCCIVRSRLSARWHSA